MAAHLVIPFYQLNETFEEAKPDEMGTGIFGVPVETAKSTRNGKHNYAMNWIICQEKTWHK